MKLSGAQIFVECLKEHGVDTIFGYPGGVLLSIYDALYDADIRHILTRHEQGAVHAADGYARATGKPGVCLATSGPGATNLVTGIANAYMDSIPIVAFTGQVTVGLLGRDSFQEADITGITMPITKHNYLVKDVSELAVTIKEAFYIATTGRPGPVLVDIPKDVTTAAIEYQKPGSVNLPGYDPVTEPPLEQLTLVAEAINESARPIIYAGGGVVTSGAHNELRQLAELLLAPVTNTLMGLGSFPGDHPLFLGMLGMHGTKYANYAICEADLIIAIGARFDDRVTGKLDTFAKGAKVVHIDIDPAEIGKNVGVHYPVVGDVKVTLSKLLGLIKAKQPSEWQTQIETWKKDYPLEFVDEGMKPQFVIREIDRLTRDRNVFITTDVGQHQMWAAQYLTLARPRSFFTSGGLGTMGYGFPAALGVQAAYPGETVLGISGDGSFQMNIQELATAVNYNLPVKIAIMNNGFLGMVRQWQDLFFDKRYSQTRLQGNPDFVKIAEAYGAVGMRITKREEVAPALEEALAIPKPVVMDFVVEQEENVFPMVPAGADLKDMLG
ncbi:biosynthetic-type acetolactate synthase large subunit [Desulfolucanica intricata]|uniref:biosynthetic-type acetolactate synthase large subunit n=1 Tax=Desulfolucanica intricata TaxID=1285191 RepID=UPI00082D7789|nr:biosynthetic-type acetolactate synthase large subunit [Desulfolucanica intricata]